MGPPGYPGPRGEMGPRGPQVRFLTKLTFLPCLIVFFQGICTCPRHTYPIATSGFSSSVTSSGLAQADQRQGKIVSIKFSAKVIFHLLFKIHLDVMVRSLT